MARFAKEQREKDEKFLRDGGSPLELAAALRQRAETNRRKWIRKDWFDRADLTESEQRQLEIPMADTTDDDMFWLAHQSEADVHAIDA
jgi:hypothetical protein